MEAVINKQSAQKASLEAHPKCKVERREGGAVVHFRIDPQAWARFETRIGKNDPSEYMWQLIRAMIDGHVW